MDLALNNLQWLICHKTKPNQTKPSLILLPGPLYIAQSAGAVEYIDCTSAEE